MLIFITDMGEPWNHDAMSKNFLMVDFQLLAEQNDDAKELERGIPESPRND